MGVRVRLSLGSTLILVAFLGLVLGLAAERGRAARREAEWQARVAALNEELMATRQAAAAQARQASAAARALARRAAEAEAEAASAGGDAPAAPARPGGVAGP